MARQIRLLLLLFLGGFFLSACTMLRPRIDMASIEDMPMAFSSNSTNAVMESEWWKSFGNDELNCLVAGAFSNNLSFAQAVSRFKQARATAAKLSAGVFPSVSASASIAKTKDRSVGDDGVQVEISKDSYALGLAASYELDLWGRVYSTRRSAGLGADASFLDLETAAMSLAARVSELWVQLIEAKGLVALVEQQVETNRRALEILKDRATKANASLLDVYQQEQLLRSSESALPAARQRLELLKNEFDIMLGMHAGTGPDIRTEKLPDMPSITGNGVPSDLLINRPDVKAQQRRLNAAGYDLAAARASQLPTISISASYNFSSEESSSLFDNWISRLAANLAGPVFEGGKRRAEVQRSRAALEEDLAAYRETVLEAFKDCQDALIVESRAKESVQALSKQVSSARKLVSEAERRYRNGNTPYLSLLTALKSLYQAEQGLISAKSSLLQARIGLHRALGGGWIDESARCAVQRDFIESVNKANEAQDD